MDECDTLLMVGSSFPYSEFLPEDGRRAACRSTSTGGCSASATRWRSSSSATRRRRCEELIPLLERKSDRSWREQIEDEVAEWWRLMEERAMQDADPINPQRVFWELYEAPARRRDHQLRLGLVGELVRARREAEARA